MANKSDPSTSGSNNLGLGIRGYNEAQVLQSHMAQADHDKYIAIDKQSPEDEFYEVTNNPVYKPAVVNKMSFGDLTTEVIEEKTAAAENGGNNRSYDMSNND